MARRFVALTANAMAGERERCIAAGMDDYLAKPFKSVELLAAVENRPRAGPAPATSDDVEPVDLQGLRTDLELGGVVDIMDDILETFANDSSSRMEALRAAVASGDPVAIERAAHAFKSGASTIRARPLAALLQGLERDARAAMLDDAASTLTRIEQATAAVQRHLQSARGAETHGE
jgi:HPt (histidine-containing phosphotransfer) domain-containing protein